MRPRVNTLLPAILIAFWAYSCAMNNGVSTENTSIDSYDKLCRIFELGLSSGLQRADLGEFISERVAEELNGTDAEASYQAMLMLNQEDRYNTVQSAASLQLGSEWQCAAMQTLLSP